jgi:hypothetical protein
VADRLLQGTVAVETITDDPFGQAFLVQCKRVNPVLLAGISINEFKASYNTWQVGTSTSPSRRHLSHQHALFQPHGIDNLLESDKYNTAKASQELNWFAQYGIVSYGIQHGYTFDRWKQVVNAMIEKDPGNPQLHRLRVIHLYKSDNNSLLGIKMRQVIHNAEDRKSLNVGLSGSQGTRQVVDPAIIEVCWPELKFSNIATSCYNRIIPLISNVIA